ISGNADTLSIETKDGAGFVSHLRSWARRNEIGLPPIVIFTNKSEAFANELPAVGAALPVGDFRGREHRIGPALDVEWLLFKNDNGVSSKIAALTDGYVLIRRLVGEDGASIQEITETLSLRQDVEWYSRAADDLRRARPPVTEKETGSRGPRDT